jgi:hypothetical protein
MLSTSTEKEICATDYRANQRIKRIRVMVFNATFNNISVISWWSGFIGGGNRSTQRKPPTNFIT